MDRKKNNFYGDYTLIKNDKGGTPTIIVENMVIYDSINPYRYEKNTDEFVEITLEDKGISLYDDKLKIGMRLSDLIAEYEFFIFDNKEHLNQFKVYDKNSKIKQEESSFFTLDLSDTIQIGENAGRLNYNSIPGKDSEKHLYVIIDNEYEGGIKKNDTFYIENDKNRFGVYAYKPGFLNVKGTILYRELYVLELDKERDSFGLEFKDHYKYFEKEVYVRDTIK